MFNPFAAMRSNSIFRQPPRLDEGTLENPYAGIKKRFLGQSPASPPEPRQPNFAVEEEMSMPPTPKSNMDGYFEALEANRTNRPIRTQYEEALKAPRPQEKTSKKRRLGAAIAGGLIGMGDPKAGFETASNIAYKPYDTAIRDQNRQLSTLKEGAESEDKSRDEKYKTLEAARAMGLDYDKLDLENWKAGEDVLYKRRGQKETERRNDAYIENLSKPGYQYRSQEDGSILEIEEGTGKSRVIPGSTIEAASLKVSQRNAATGEKNQTSLASYRDFLKTVKNSDGSTPSPSEQKTALDLAARELQKDPEYADYFSSYGTGEGLYRLNNDTSPKAQAVKRKLRELAKQILEDGIPFLDDADVEDEDDVIWEP